MTITRNFIFYNKSDTLPEQPVIFVDGSDHLIFRQGYDFELSHWVPNYTPLELKADTSTGICLKFLDSKYNLNQSLLLNNHLDSDGVLSAFTLIHPSLARKNAATIKSASRMGDFGAGGCEKALELWTGLVNEIHKTNHQCNQEAYLKGIELVRLILEGKQPYSEDFEEAIQCLERSKRWIDDGELERNQISKRFTHFHLPKALCQRNGALLPYFEPNFDVGVEKNHLLPRQVRNQLDEQKVQLISVEESKGYSYDLLIPQYMWAETPDSWRFPGFICMESSNRYELVHPELEQATRKLMDLEINPGSWVMAKNMSPFQSVKGRGFPVILSFLKDSKIAPSSIPPNEVSAIIGEALEKP